MGYKNLGAALTAARLTPPAWSSDVNFVSDLSASYAYEILNKTPPQDLLLAEPQLPALIRDARAQLCDGFPFLKEGKSAKPRDFAAAWTM